MVKGEQGTADVIRILPMIYCMQGFQKTCSLTHLSFKGSNIGDRAAEGTVGCP